MRIILGLAAALGAAAIGGAATARSALAFSGQGASPQGAWSPAGGQRGVAGHRHKGTGWSNGPERRHGRHDGRFGRHGRHGFHSYGSFGAAGIASPVEEADPHGNGFFAGDGGGIRLRGGRPYFEYDRAYPYEWASTAGGRPQWDEEEESAPPPPPRCTFESGVRVCRGW
jgi:hypothetical protein